MKYLFWMFYIPLNLFSQNLDSEKVLNYAAEGNKQEISNIFSNLPNLSIPQGNSFLNNLCIQVRSNITSDLEINSLQEFLWDIIDSQDATDYQKATVKNIVSQLLSDSFSSSKIAPEKMTFLKSLSLITTEIRFFPAFWIKAAIPDGVVIGAVETLAGALLFLTPFRAVGTGMMVDGVRRMLNSVESTPLSDKSVFEE